MTMPKAPTPTFFVDDNPRGGVRVLTEPAIQALTATLYGVNPALAGKVVMVKPLASSGSTKLASLWITDEFMARGQKGVVPVLEWVKQFATGGYKVAIANFAGKPLDLTTLDGLLAGELGLAVDQDEQLIAGAKVTQPSAIYAGYAAVKRASVNLVSPSTKASLLPLAIGGAVVLGVVALMMRKPSGYARNGRAVDGFEHRRNRP